MRGRIEDAIDGHRHRVPKAYLYTYYLPSVLLTGTVLAGIGFPSLPCSTRRQNSPIPLVIPVHWIDMVEQMLHCSGMHSPTDMAKSLCWSHLAGTPTSASFVDHLCSCLRDLAVLLI